MSGIPGRRDSRTRASRNADRVQIRCLIVDDDQPFLDAAHLLLEREGVAVVGVATTSAEACWSTSASVASVVSTLHGGCAGR